MLHYEDSLVEVHKVVVGPMDNNVHVVRCKETGEAVLIDAARETLRGDKVMPSDNDVPLNFMPSAPRTCLQNQVAHTPGR